MNRLLFKLLLVVLFMGVAAAASAQTLRVTADRTNLRDKASTDGAIVVALSMGEELEVINQTGTWYHVKVKSSGKEGFVSSLVVQVVPGTASGGGARPAAAPAPAPAPTPAPRPAARPAAQASRPAATPTGGGDDIFRLGFTDVGPVIGLGGISGAGIGFGGRFETAFKELPNLGNGTLGIGVGVDYFSFGESFSNVSGFNWRLIPISVTGNYHFHLDNKKIDPFVGAGLGYQHWSVSGPSCNFLGVNLCENAHSSGIYFVGHGGIRYFWKPNMAAYADVGAGAGALHVGLMFKMKDRK